MNQIPDENTVDKCFQAVSDSSSSSKHKATPQVAQRKRHNRNGTVVSQSSDSKIPYHRIRCYSRVFEDSS
jgi:uncharacterized protein (UPF0248 family)